MIGSDKARAAGEGGAIAVQVQVVVAFFQLVAFFLLAEIAVIPMIRLLLTGRLVRVLTSCKSCHGPDGTPNPAVAKMMKVEMKDLKTSDADIASVVTKGQGKMKAVTAVTGKSVDDVAAYVHSLKK